jgi:hypothetical protein
MLRQWAYIAAIDKRNPVTAACSVWHGMVMHRRSSVRQHMDKLAYYDGTIDGYRADLERGTARRTGKPYTLSDIKRIHSSIAWAIKRCKEKQAELENLVQTPIPSYREWCAMAAE